MVLILKMNMSEFHVVKRSLMRDIGIHLRTIINIQQDDTDTSRVYPYYFSGESNTSGERYRRGADEAEGTQAYFVVDNAACTSEETDCSRWDNADYAAQMLAMDDVVDGDIGQQYAIHSVYCECLYFLISLMSIDCSD